MLRNRSLPPLGPLRGFEAAARLGSFTRAAAELHLTQTAISHQVRTLEARQPGYFTMRSNPSWPLDPSAKFVLS